MQPRRGLVLLREEAPINLKRGKMASATVNSVSSRPGDEPTKWCSLTDSKTPTGVADVPLTDIAVEAFRSQIEWRALALALPERRQPDRAPDRIQKDWRKTLRKAGVPYFRLDSILRSTTLHG